MSNLRKLLLISVGAILILSLTQCCTSQKEISEESQIVNKNHVPIRQLPQGSAEVTATAIKLIKENIMSIGLFRIDTVIGYGPSTSPIGVGSEIKIEYDSQLFDKANNSKMVSMELRKQYRFTIRENPSLPVEKPHVKWKLVKINKFIK